MSVNLAELNYLAIIAAVILSQLLGALWYSNALFAKSWLKELGITPTDIDKKAALRGMLFGALLSVFVFFIIAIILEAAEGFTWGNGAFFGFILSMLVSFQIAINYLYEGKSRKLFLINALYTIITYTIGGAIIGLWQ